MQKKCIIITTINKPTQQILSYASNHPDWDLIVVGDSKTPSEFYKAVNCYYLSIEEQYRIFPELSRLIPLNSYARKNLGYAYAYLNNYTLIYDTDDDNYSNIVTSKEEYNSKEVRSNGNFINIYKLYTNNIVWPRGLPLRYIHSEVIESNTQYICPVIQGLVNGDPDVDAVFRITNNLNSEKFTTFESNNTETYALAPYTFCPFNSQNTYWTNPKIFYLTYLPSTVSMRFTDILRGYIAEHQLWKLLLNVKFTQANAIQQRNQHDLAKDLVEEIEMFQYTEDIIEWLVEHKNKNIIDVYEWLVTKNIVQPKEMQIINCWKQIFDFK